jgi:signal transduction histidine kinase/DNA-binding response OmpR family regulator
MVLSKERILLVESDPDASNMISCQVLKPQGYQVRVVEDVTTAIREAIQFAPDVVVVNLEQPGLSGKDFLVALSSQRINLPIIVIAKEDLEREVIQAFRLGASDYLSWPVRETEMVAAVERALEQVRAKRERERLSQQLENANLELQQRVRELTTIYGIGKAVTSLTDQRKLFNKLIDGGVSVAGADRGWLLLRHDDSSEFTLSACVNMPNSIEKLIGQSWDDGISSLVALSGEPLLIHGNPLKRFKVTRLGKSVLVVPVKAQKEVVGLIVVMRESTKAFSASNQTMLEAVADYASISLMNAQLFTALEKRARSLQKAIENAKGSERVKISIFQNISSELRTPITAMRHQIDILIEDINGMRADHRSSINLLEKNVDQLGRIVSALDVLQKMSTPKKLELVDLVGLTKRVFKRFEETAEVDRVSLMYEFQSDPMFVRIDNENITEVFEILLSNAIRYSAGGRIEIQARETKNGFVHVIVQDSGPGIDLEHREKIFEPFYQINGRQSNIHDGLGIGLFLAKEIVKFHGGDMWLKSEQGNGSKFHFTLPAA